MIFFNVSLCFLFFCIYIFTTQNLILKYGVDSLCFLHYKDVIDSQYKDFGNIKNIMDQKGIKIGGYLLVF